MLRNFFKIAFRVMIRNKSYSLINILGLATGVACCLILTLYIYGEASYDKHHHEGENLYRVVTHFHGDIVASITQLGSCSPPIGPALQREIPEVEISARVLPAGFGNGAQSLVRYSETAIYEDAVNIADSSFFDLFSYTFDEGNPRKALNEPNSIVITRELSGKLFGDEPALNKIVSITLGNAPQDYHITGVIFSEHESIVAPNLIISMMSSGGMAEYVRSDQAMNEWAGQNFLTTYVRLRPGSDIKAVETKMDTLLVKYGAEDMKDLGFTKTLTLEPVQDIYLKSDVGQTPRIRTLYVIGSIAGFILLIACINFLNLATAKATRRAGEIGVRKVMGAARRSIVSQLLGEATLTVSVSILIGMLIVELVLPAFNGITSKSISLSQIDPLFLAGAILTMLLLTGFLAGAYPALHISGFQPARVLKGQFSLSSASGVLRKVLVVFQFTVAIILVCGLLHIGRQLTFMQNKDLGFEVNKKIVVPLRTQSAKDSYKGLKQELLTSSMIDHVTAADYLPGMLIFNDYLLYPDGSSMKNAIRVFMNTADADYMDGMGMELIAGRQFTPNDSAERDHLIVNAAGAKAFGFTPQEALGRKVYMDWHDQKITFEIIGVMKDYNQMSLRDVIEPTAVSTPSFNDFDFRYDNLIVSVAGNDLQKAVKLVENTWDSQVKDTPFEYSFLDQDLQKQYLEDQRLSKIVSVFTIIALFISCLGLYGLSSFMAERRFKEIGIRKVMGASVGQIVNLLSAEFAKLVIIAFALAIPISWYAMSLWLSGFAYRIGIDPLVFLYAGIVSLLIALLTVSFESIRAAIVNPVKSLRTE